MVVHQFADEVDFGIPIIAHLPISIGLAMPGGVIGAVPNLQM
jgi:hypothetical protein